MLRSARVHQRAVGWVGALSSWATDAVVREAVEGVDRWVGEGVDRCVGESELRSARSINGRLVGLVHCHRSSWARDVEVREAVEGVVRSVGEGHRLAHEAFWVAAPAPNRQSDNERRVRLHPQKKKVTTWLPALW